MGDFLRVLLSIILPPLGVALEVGVKNKHFWINIVLTLLGYLPGLVHAVWIIVTTGPSHTLPGERAASRITP